VLGVIQAGRFVFAKTAEVESQSRSLAILAGSAEKAGQIIKELQDLGAVTPFTSTELIDSAKRLQAFGVEADKVVETTRRLADASGATGAELSGLVTAYGQVQAKGRLQGEELLQFQERGIALQEELRKMYGMTAKSFKKLSAKVKSAPKP
jgi:tape measure domain-containing protein